MFKMTASYLTDPSSIEVCGVTSLDSLLYCWRLGNSTSWWQKLDNHVEYNSIDDDDDDYDEEEDVNDEHQPCSHRNGAATIIVEDEQFMFGGKR